MANTAFPFGFSVLLVDDDALVAIDCEDTLRKLGVARVATACSQSAALKLCESGVFDAALLDVKLGEETSFAVADRLIAKGIPFAFLTGFSDTSGLPDRFSQVAVVGKPADADRLAIALSKLLKPA